MVDLQKQYNDNKTKEEFLLYRDSVKFIKIKNIETHVNTEN